MLDWLKSLFRPPEPAGPPRTVRAFAPSDQPITRDGVVLTGDGWRIDAGDTRTVCLFEIPDPGVEQCTLAYRARMKTANVRGRAYLEMWCQFPGGGDYFSKGFHHAVRGANDWASCETPFYLKKGQRPELIKLNLVVEGGGTVWLKDLELRETPLK